MLHAELRGLDSELFAVYDAKDACTILALAMLRIEHKGIKISRCRAAYEKSFISRYYPGLALSENTIGKFLNLLGQDISKQTAFFSARLAAVAKDHHIIIDGTLKQDTSIVNELSAFSRKARVKGCRDISVLYAYDLENKEPLCAEVFPGNMIDARAYRSFVEDNKIKHGVLLTDKGFPVSEIADVLRDKPDLHFVTPIKRNDSRISKHHMLDFDDCLRGTQKRVRCKKVCLGQGRYLYSFKDSTRAMMEDNAFMDRQRRSKAYDKQAYDRQGQSFGTIVFESDVDLTCLEVYQIYEQRWWLELLFDCYKNSLGFDVTRVESDYSVRGSEFVDFISTVLTNRIVKRMSAAGVLDKETFGDVITALRGCWRSSKAPLEELPGVNDGHWNRLLKCEEVLLMKLSLVKEPESAQPQRKSKPQIQQQSAELPKRKPGRPRKKPIFVGPPRPRGRPRKIVVAEPEKTGKTDRIRQAEKTEQSDQTSQAKQAEQQ